MFDWSTKIHIPSEIHFETWIDLSTATLDPYAPNTRNKYRNLHRAKEEKKMRTLEFKIDDDSPQKIAHIDPVTPSTATQTEEQKEEEELIWSYIEESEDDVGRT